MIHAKLFAAALAALMLIASLCSCGSNTGQNIVNNEFHTTVPFGAVPDDFKDIVERNLFYKAEAFKDKLLKCNTADSDEKGYSMGYVTESLGFDGKTLAKVTLETGYGYRIYGLTATSDGGFIFTLAFSDHIENGKWMSEDGFSSYIVKYDKNGNQEWKTEFESVEGRALREIREVGDHYYVFGDFQTPETKTVGVGSPTDIMLVKLDKSGNAVNKRLIGGSSFDWIDDDTIAYEKGILTGGYFTFSAYVQSKDGDFKENGSKDGYPVKLTIKVDTDFNILSMNKNSSKGGVRERVGFLDGKEIFRNDIMFNNFADGYVTAIVDYGDKYLIVSENRTGIYENTPQYISSTWYNTETVYGMYDKSGKLLWKDAVKSSHYEDMIFYFDDPYGSTAPEATEEPISVPTMPDDDTIRARYVRPNARPDGTYGIDRFSITLYNDGTCQYYETMISSYIGVGKYTIDGDLLTLTDDNIVTLNGPITKTFKFKIVGDTLVFIADGSDSFTFIKLPDGAVFGKE
ncbi:MAG: hypothetical protein IKP68_02010 [Clostridia bacterium]|nr:hypothetical protein [Clostridia bacterium]